MRALLVHVVGEARRNDDGRSAQGLHIGLVPEHFLADHVWVDPNHPGAGHLLHVHTTRRVRVEVLLFLLLVLA